jgi:hypothetical protein
MNLFRFKLLICTVLLLNLATKLVHLFSRKNGSHRFDSRWGHGMFSAYLILPAILWSWVDWVSNRNEYQESSGGGGIKHGRCMKLTTFLPSVSRLSTKCGFINISQPYRPPWRLAGDSFTVRPHLCGYVQACTHVNTCSRWCLSMSWPIFTHTESVWRKVGIIHLHLNFWISLVIIDHWGALHNESTMQNWDNWSVIITNWHNLSILRQIFLLQASRKLASASLGGSTPPLDPQENTRLHTLIDHIFQEVDRIKRELWTLVCFQMVMKIIDIIWNILWKWIIWTLGEGSDVFMN